MSSRLGEIKTWLSNVAPELKLDTLQSLQSDASARKYLRCNSDNSSFIIMDTVPGEEMVRFSQIAKLLTSYKLSAPTIIQSNLDQGLLLISDLGSKTYLEALKGSSQETVNKLYLDAINSIIMMQRIPSTNEQYILPVMNAAYINDRINVFKTWYLQKHLNLAIDPKIDSMLNNLQNTFLSVFSEQPPVFVHVDYHCRNLMVLESGNPGIIDFQDAMLGPATYDLVSLLQDAYITHPRSLVESWIETYKKMATEAGLIPPQTTSNLLRNFDLVGLQRHIKNLGVFARLHHRDQKSNYLNDMPMLIKYITETCDRYPDFSWLSDFLKQNVLEVSL